MMHVAQPARASLGRGRAGSTFAPTGFPISRALARTDLTYTQRQHHQASSLVSTSTTGGATAVTGRSAAPSALLRPIPRSIVALPCSSLAHTFRKMSSAPREEHTRSLGGSTRNGNPGLLPQLSRISGSLTTPTRPVLGRRISSCRGEQGARAAAEARCRGLDTPRRGMSSTTMSERDFHSVADEALEDIHDAVEEALEEGFPEDFDCNMSQGVLNIVVGDRGTWVLNKQSPNRQIWWSSPVSGPMRFEYHEDSSRWLNTRDGETELQAILAMEMRDKCGVSI
ncbi:unnamed protein product [Scytosiphon promiscuus]